MRSVLKIRMRMSGMTRRKKRNSSAGTRMPESLNLSKPLLIEVTVICARFEDANC